MTVLFGYSKREDVTQNEAFTMAAIAVGVLSLLTLFIVKNPKIKERNQGDVEREEELQTLLLKGSNQPLSINEPYETMPERE